MPPLDHDHCYAVVQSRDRRFDGWFVTGVTTTGIYCRPSCPAITPRRRNVEFFPTAATAQQRGFRACKRCRPDASPGSPEWNTRQDVVARTMRLIADGIVEREGVGGLARRLGYSERHLNRMLTAELGAGPLAIARAQRAHTARLLMETTAMPLTDVAFASGFGSVRQFNDTIRAVFDSTPSALRPPTSAAGRRAGVSAGAGGVTSVSLRLATRAPFAGGELLEFIGRRAIPGIEAWDGTTYRRSLDLPSAHGVVELVAHDDHVGARLLLASWTDLAAAVQRLRRLLDLDNDPVAVDEALSAHPGLAPVVRRVPGRRAPGSVDPFETAVRAVVGQQVSVAGARTVAARLIAAVAPSLTLDDDLTHVFPGPDALAVVPDSALSMPSARRDTIRRLACAVGRGGVELHPGVDPHQARGQLLAIAGIGPWTADYVIMRGLGHPDTFLAADLGVRQALGLLGIDPSEATRWSPWRAYAVHHLWSVLTPANPSPRSTP
jgi:AraC family transcriptional regulator, regulatory protein of adaptative response / DNA-3-methyladenine glycosylase II